MVPKSRLPSFCQESVPASPVTVEEKFESRIVTTGQNPSIELRYILRGTGDQWAATAAMGPASPELYDPYGSSIIFYPRESVTVQPVGDLLWEGIVRYGPVPQTNASTFSFDTGGGTQHITQSLATVARYAPPGKTAPDFTCGTGFQPVERPRFHRRDAGATPDSVEGVDTTVPVYQFSETHYLPDATVTPAYKGTLFALTGRVNSAVFKGFAVGECLFLGASGAKRGGGDWEIAYRFAASPNVTGLVIGEITGIAKQGWEYLWVRYADTEDAVAKALVKRPVAVYIEQVYPYGDLNVLGI